MEYPNNRKSLRQDEQIDILSDKILALEQSVKEMSDLLSEPKISIMSFQIMRFDTCVISLFLVFIHN